jgi:vacuolar-type H+-ATPase subunit C/Vma6
MDDDDKRVEVIFEALMDETDNDETRNAMVTQLMNMIEVAFTAVPDATDDEVKFAIHHYQDANIDMLIKEWRKLEDKLGR